MPAVLQKKDSHLQEALDLVEKIEELQCQLAALVDSGAAGKPPEKGGSEFTAESRQRIVAALEARWTNRNAHIGEPESKPGNRQTREENTSVEHAPKAAPFDPFEAGRKAVAQMQEAEGGAWTGAELESLYDLKPANLHKRRAEHRIVWWRDAKNQFHYPKWQFNAAGALLTGVQEVLQTFRSSDEWRVMRYFLALRQQLDERTPLDVLRAGEVDKVVAHAKAHAQENSW